MPSHYKYYELYSLGCFSSRTERLAVSLGFCSLLVNSFLFLASLSSEPLWGVGPLSLFHMFAVFTLFYAGWADQPSYCWFFLVINGFTIFGLALTFAATFLLDLNPQAFSQFRGEIYPPGPDRNELRQMELGLLVLILVQWMGQGLIWHYYQYLKHSKAEHFVDSRAQAQLGSFNISTAKRLQIASKYQLNGK